MKFRIFRLGMNCCNGLLNQMLHDGFGGEKSWWRMKCRTLGSGIKIKCRGGDELPWSGMKFRT